MTTINTNEYNRIVMSTGQLRKVDIYARVLKLKNDLSQGDYKSEWDNSAKLKAHAVLNDVLDIINEYRY